MKASDEWRTGFSMTAAATVRAFFHGETYRNSPESRAAYAHSCHEGWMQFIWGDIDDSDPKNIVHPS